MAEPWLTGWKRIAAHIGMDEQTAKTMHREYGMPVRELPSGTKVAFPSELLDWLVRYNTKMDKRKEKA
jgi:hypothetical protein